MSRISTVSCVTMFFALLASGQTLGQNQAKKLFAESVTLHQKNEIAKAMQKLAQARKLTPRDPYIAGYFGELQALAKRYPLDSHAIQATKGVEKSIKTLAQYLMKPVKSDRDKARLIYVWVTSRIAYDVDSFFSGGEGAIKPDDVLKQRKALCGGYAYLFNALAKEAGIEAVVIIGGYLCPS